MKKATKLKNPLMLVEARGQKIFTTSMRVAEEFKKSYSVVLRALKNLSCSNEFSRCNFALRDCLDERGKVQPMYEITKDSFMFLAMGFTGREAAKWKELFIADFNAMAKRLTEPGRKEAIKEKCTAASDMMDMLSATRELDGKETLPRHYQNEHYFYNRALTSVWGPIIESDLDVYDTRQLRAIRKRNTQLIGRFPKQADKGGRYWTNLLLNIGKSIPV